MPIVCMAGACYLHSKDDAKKGGGLDRMKQARRQGKSVLQALTDLADYNEELLVLSK